MTKIVNCFHVEYIRLDQYQSLGLLLFIAHGCDNKQSLSQPTIISLALYIMFVMACTSHYVIFIVWISSELCGYSDAFKTFAVFQTQAT
jgi:hypothetical protein